MPFDSAQLNTKYFIFYEGGQTGPWAFLDVRRKFAASNLDCRFWIRQEGRRYWRRAADVSGFRIIFTLGARARSVTSRETPRAKRHVSGGEV